MLHVMKLFSILEGGVARAVKSIARSGSFEPTRKSRPKASSQVFQQCFHRFFVDSANRICLNLLLCSNLRWYSFKM